MRIRSVLVFAGLILLVSLLFAAIKEKPVLERCIEKHKMASYCERLIHQKLFK